MATDILKTCSKSLLWAQNQDYKGYSKFDALNSPILRIGTRYSTFLRKAVTFANSRMPVNVRGVLGVQKKQNPKGLALFARSYFNLFRLTDNRDFLDEAERILKILLEVSREKDFSGHSWGYEHPWQNITFFIPPYEPNCVVTCAVGEAFYQGWLLTKNNSYLDICKSVAQFILNDLTNIDVGSSMRCCSYDLHSNWKVINVNSFAAAFLARLYNATKDEKYINPSKQMMKWVISQKTDYNAWYYTDPPEASRITHDNYHTGFVLDSIYEYLQVFPDDSYHKIMLDGLTFYKEQLFNNDYAPKWMHNKSFPHDIHGAAQGIITFSRFSQIDNGHKDFAKGILNWTLENMYNDKQNRFYYQQSKNITKRFTLMRWCQAWMCYAMSELSIYMDIDGE